MKHTEFGFSLCPSLTHSLTHSLSHSPLLSLYPSDRQVTCDPPGEAALWVKHTEFGFSLCPSPTLPLYHSPTLPLYHSPTLPLYASDRQETVTRQGRHPVIVTGPTSLLPRVRLQAGDNGGSTELSVTVPNRSIARLRRPV